jgi:hypothetical protein
VFKKNSKKEIKQSNVDLRHSAINTIETKSCKVLYSFFGYFFFKNENSKTPQNNNTHIHCCENSRRIISKSLMANKKTGYYQLKAPTNPPKKDIDST